MTDGYRPEPFPSPFASDFDPRQGLYEVVSVDPSGALKLASSGGEFVSVPAQAVSTDVNRAVGERVSIARAPDDHPSLSAAGLRVMPLRPNEKERAFAANWLGDLRSAGLNVEGVSSEALDQVLVERLRTAPFGSEPIPPLRRVLRELLETLVGRFPGNDHDWRAHEARPMMAEFLAKLGVLEAPMPALAKKKNVWEALAPLVEAANRALAKAGTPVRLVCCEREVFPAELFGYADHDVAPFPIWLALTPSSALELQKVNVLRLYRSVRIPLAVAAPDPRRLVLRPVESAVPPAAAEVTSLGFAVNPSNLGPPQTPCRATIRTFVPMDATGEMVTEDGLSVRFGRSACKNFDPAAGLAVWLIDATPHPAGRGYRAKVVNLTGKKEGDRLSDIEALNRENEVRRQREAAILEDLGRREAQCLTEFQLTKSDWHYWDQLLPLPAGKRRELATRLVMLKKESHLFDRLFEELVTLDPRAFHPHLADLDWRVEPESLAWTNAPPDGVAFAIEMLRRGRALQLRTRLAPGSSGPAYEMARRDRSPANDVGAAVLALARCGEPSAIAAIEAWARVSRIDNEELNALLVVAGWQCVAGKLQRLWGGARAQRMVRDESGQVSLFRPSNVECAACGDRLTCLVGGDAAPFPVFTCASCTVIDFDPYFVEVSERGIPSPLMVEGVLSDYEPSFPRDAAVPSLTVRLEDAPDAVPDELDKFDHLARIGGHPSWVQPPRHAGTCPKCSRLLVFALQIPDPPGADNWGGDSGMLYAFVCGSCRVSATFVQSH